MKSTYLEEVGGKTTTGPSGQVRKLRVIGQLSSGAGVNGLLRVYFIRL